VVEPVSTFAEVAARARAVLAAPGGDPPSLARTVVLVGPEGGWSAEEDHVGIARMSLGDHVLRAETAAIAACSVLAALRSRLAGDMSQAAGS